MTLDDVHFALDCVPQGSDTESIRVLDECRYVGDATEHTVLMRPLNGGAGVELLLLLNAKLIRDGLNGGGKATPLATGPLSRRHQGEEQ